MPAVKISEMERRRRTVSGIIKKRMAQAGYEAAGLAKRLKVSEVTIYNWIKAPEKCSLDKLWTLCDAIKVSDVERMAIMGGKEVETLEEAVRR